MSEYVLEMTGYREKFSGRSSSLKGRQPPGKTGGGPRPDGENGAGKSTLMKI